MGSAVAIGEKPGRRTGGPSVMVESSRSEMDELHTRVEHAEREAAEARGREAAATARAEKLAAANAVFREAAAWQGDLDAFLGRVLLTITDLLAAQSGTLWLLTQEPAHVVLHAEVDGGAVVFPSAAGHPKSGLGRPLAGVLGASGDLGARRPFVVPVHAHPLLSDGEQAYLMHKGVRVLIEVPIVLGNALFGSFTICLTEDRPSLESDGELIEALANHAAVALHVTRLTEQARDAAVARDREQAALRRAEALARANAAIRSTLDRLAERQDLAAFLSEAVRVCARELGAVGAGIWVHSDEPEPDELVVSLEDGVVRFRNDMLHPGRIRQPRTPETSSNDPKLRRGEIVIEAGEQLRGTSWYPRFREYLEARGIRAVASVPLFVGERWVGTIVLRHTTELAGYEPERRELAIALANQVALALELTRLAEQTRDAAIARARADELAKANTALQRAVERLVLAGDVDEMIDAFLLESVAAVGADSGAIHRRAEDGSFAMLALVDGGQLRRPQRNKPADAPLRQQTSEDPTGTMRPTLAGHHRVDLGSLERWFPEAAEYHRRRGHKSMWHVPYRFGGLVTGFVELAFRDERELAAEALETIQALAHQTWLAMEGRRLADEAREAALAKEREAVARQRAAELQRANEALRRTTARLAADSRLEVYLGHVLLEACAHVGSDAGHLTTYDAARRTLATASLVQDGAVLPADAFLPEILLGEQETFFDVIIREGRPRVFDLNSEQHLFVPGAVEYHTDRKHTHAYAIPLMIEGQPLGHIGIATRASGPMVGEQLAFLQALAHQAALAIQLTRLSEEARTAAVAKEREAAASARLADLARANAALQDVTDALAGAQTLDEIVPAVLGIVAQTFDCEAVGHFEIAGETVTLRHWRMGDRVLTPDDFLSLDTIGEHAVTRQLAEGFIMPDNFLGTSPRENRRAVLIDHRLGTAKPELDDWAIRNGWPLEMNVPLVVDGRVLGALTLYRSADERPYTESEVALVEGLAKQLALAVELNRLAEEARDAALAREREVQANRRAEALARISEAGRMTLQRLSEKPELDGFLGHVLTVAAEQFGAVGGGVWLAREQQTQLVLTLEDGVVRSADESLHPGRRGTVDLFGGTADLTERVRDGLRVQQQARAILTWGPAGLRNDPVMSPYRGYFADRGIVQVTGIPMFFGNEYRGSLTLRFVHERTLGREEEELAHALANQAVLALELSRLADEARDATIQAERGRLARDVHDTLAQGYASLAFQLGYLAHEVHASPALSERLARLGQVAREHVAQARRTIAALRAGAGSETLHEQLVQLVDSYRRGGEGRLSLGGVALRIDGEPARQLALLAQEAVANALRHARPHTVVITTTRTDHEVVLTIEDDGQGFDLATATTGFGLTTMRERAEDIGAAITISSVTGQGTRIEVRWQVRVNGDDDGLA